MISLGKTSVIFRFLSPWTFSPRVYFDKTETCYAPFLSGLIKTCELPNPIVFFCQGQSDVGKRCLVTSRGISLKPPISVRKKKHHLSHSTLGIPFRNAQTVFRSFVMLGIIFFGPRKCGLSQGNILLMEEIRHREIHSIFFKGFHA